MYRISSFQAYLFIIAIHGICWKEQIEKNHKTKLGGHKHPVIPLRNTHAVVSQKCSFFLLEAEWDFSAEEKELRQKILCEHGFRTLMKKKEFFRTQVS